MLDGLALNLGSLLQISILVVTVIGLFFGMKNEIKVLRHDVQSIDKQLIQLSAAFTQLSTVLTKLAVQDTKITMLDKTMDDLRHGKGFVKNGN